jgi:hypothetical protein
MSEFAAIRRVLAAHRSTAARISEEEVTAAWVEFDEARRLLVRAEEALKASYKAALTVKPTLDRPYRDKPQWTPWTRWVETAAAGSPRRASGDPKGAARRPCLEPKPGTPTRGRVSAATRCKVCCTLGVARSDDDPEFRSRKVVSK